MRKAAAGIQSIWNIRLSFARFKGLVMLIMQTQPRRKPLEIETILCLLQCLRTFLTSGRFQIICCWIFSDLLEFNRLDTLCTIGLQSRSRHSRRLQPGNIDPWQILGRKIR